jgi:hypothetical protein
MPRMRKSAAPARTACAALLALFLALRVLVSAGYVPTLEHGRLGLMLCPDGEWTVPAAAMPGMDSDQGSKSDHHQQCFYAAAAAMSFAGAELVPLLQLLAVAFACLGVAALPALLRRSAFERPFSTGPPFPA